MTDLYAYVQQVVKAHVATDGMCDECTHQWPCPDYRLAEDWKRQRGDLVRAWKNRTGAELSLVSKYICVGCSEKDTGMMCVSCIDELTKALEETVDETDND